MLPFGSFLTNIPFLILACVYLLYFGASVLTRTKSADDSCLANEKVIAVKEPAAQKATGSIHYSDLVNSSSALVVEEPEIQKLPEYTLLPVCIPDIKIVSYHQSFSLFSRPPPVLG